MSRITLATEAEHVNFSSIDHFRTFLKELRRFYKSTAEEDIPKSFTLEGTTKLHGTHADIVFRKNQQDGTWEMWCQSRNRVLTLEQDNCGFANFIHNIPQDVIQQLLQSILDIYKKCDETNSEVHEVIIAGEFCGASIQKLVALTSLPKMFVIFDIKINALRQDFTPYRSIEFAQHGIYNIARAGIFTTTMTLENTEATVPILQQITETVEKECPFAKTFGISGLGEGVVWKCRVLGKNGRMVEDARFWFKVKGEEHAVSRVKTLKSSKINSEDIKNANDFVTKAVLPARLEQGLDYLREMNLTADMKNMGTYLKWVMGDVMKEEGDAIEELGLDASLVKKNVTEKAKRFYLNKIQTTP